MPHPRREQPAVWEHELHGHRRRVVVGKQGHQGAALEVLLGLVAEHATQAEAVAGGGELGVGLVGADDRAKQTVVQWARSLGWLGRPRCSSSSGLAQSA